MILRSLATIVLLGLLGLNFVLPTHPLSARGSEDRIRNDVESRLTVGKSLPPLELVGLDGRIFERDDLLGHRVLLTFERSVDWCPFSKTRLLALRDAFESTPDLMIVWVMSDAQINARSRAFIDEFGLAQRVLFLADPKSQLIRKLGILDQEAEPIEVGVPHPTTLLLDRAGRIRFIDVREDFHFWLAPKALREKLSTLGE